MLIKCSLIIAVKWCNYTLSTSCTQNTSKCGVDTNAGILIKMMFVVQIHASACGIQSESPLSEVRRDIKDWLTQWVIRDELSVHSNQIMHFIEMNEDLRRTQTGINTDLDLVLHILERRGQAQLAVSVFRPALCSSPQERLICSFPIFRLLSSGTCCNVNVMESV